MNPLRLNGLCVYASMCKCKHVRKKKNHWHQTLSEATSAFCEARFSSEESFLHSFLIIIILCLGKCLQAPPGALVRKQSGE